MIGRVLCLGLALLVLVLHETGAYQPGSYNDGQATQSGLSAAQSTYGSSAQRAQEQPIYEREAGCSGQFRGLMPYAHDCHRYISCAEGRPAIETCARGTAFNPTTLRCDQESRASCEGQVQSTSQPNRSARLQQSNGEPRCPQGASGPQPHPYDCNKFLNCANGRTFVQSCGPGTAFSSTMLVCDYKHKVDCNGIPAHEQSIGSPARIICPAGIRGKHPHPNDPHKYILCGIGMQPHVEQCPLGEIFDSHQLACVYSEISSHSDISSPGRLSDLLCPEGVEGLFVHPFDQTKYLSCKAGKVAVLTCLPNYVFSISKSFCQPKTQLVYTDYVAYIVSQISYEDSLLLTRCPAGCDGLHLYPYDASKYVRCAAGGVLSIISCGEDMAYSYIQRSCRPRRQVNRAERVKFFSELDIQSSFSYTESQAFQSALNSCPRSLQGSYAYPFHAGHFVLCQNGILQVESCPTGTVYCLSSRRCLARQQLSSHDYLDYSYINIQLSTNVMQDLTTITCPTNANGYYLHPFDCTKYLNCRDQQTLIEVCGHGQVFSISHRICVARDQLEADYDRVEYLSETQNEFYQENQVEEGRQLQYNAQTVNGEVACPPGKSGVHPHPYDCNKFLNCANGQTFVQDCGPGTAFSSSLLVCDFKDKVDCFEGRSYTEGSTTSHGEPSHESGLSCPEGTRGLRPHPNDPQKYFKCGIGVQPIVEHCSMGEIFDVHSLSCVSSGINPHQNHVSSPGRLSDLLCPEGVEGFFVHPFDQTKFLHCNAGKIAVQACAPNQVFSISKSFCQPKVQLIHSDYVVYIVSQISYEDSLLLTRCPAGCDGLHLYPYDAGKYVRCAAGGVLSIISCGEDMAYSYNQRSCRPRRQVNRVERVRFFSEVDMQSSFGYTESQAFQSGLTSCPRSLQGNYAYPFHAGHFVLCQSGRLQVESCPTGTVYCLSSRRCLARQQLSSHDYLDYSYISSQVLAAKVMQDLTTITCPMNANGYYLHPFDCTKYLNCRDHQTLIEVCGQGQVFSISHRTCVARDQLEAAYDRVEYLTDTQNEFYQVDQNAEGRRLQENIHTINGEGACPPGKSGVHPHPYDCNKFLNCANGQTFVQDCRPGTAFSASLLICDFKEKVDCSYAGVSTNSQGESSHGSGLSCPEGTRGLRPHPNDPHKYLKCGIGVQPIVEQCSMDEIFDVHSLSCVSSGIDSHQNPVFLPARLSDLLCPEGVEGFFVHPFDQTKFLNCRAGKIAVQTCIPNHVFSISKSFCHPKEQLIHSDYVAYIVSQISYEDSLLLTRCPAGCVGHHLYPYDAGKYIRCAAGGVLSIISCGEDMAYSYTQRSCRPRRQVNRAERVRFFSEVDVQSSFSFTENQAFQSGLTSCPRSLQGNYTYPFHAGHFVLCQNGLLQVESCPKGTFYCLSSRRCLTQHELSSHEFLDYAYINNQVLAAKVMQDLTTITCPTNANGYYLHPFDCTKYLNCRDQQTLIEVCGQGQVFSISQRVCVATERLEAAYDRVEYLTETQNEFYQGNQLEEGRQLQHNAHTLNGEAFSYRLACSNHVYGLYAHPFDARSYLYCVEGQTLIRQCLPSELFSLSRSYCLTAELVPSTDRVSLINYNQESSQQQLKFVSCPRDAVGKHTYPFDCTQYLSCEAGVMRLQSCPSGQHFSVKHRSCQAPEQVQRTERVSSSNEQQLVYEWWQQLQRSGASSLIMCPFGLLGNYQHPILAHKFISCAAPQAQALIFDCPSGEVFSLSRRLCMPELQVSSQDRCDYASEQASYSYGWIDLRHDHREPKQQQPTYGEEDQFASGSAVRGTRIGAGDRWSNMDMQRPAGIGFDNSRQPQDQQESQSSGWSSSYNQRLPTQSVIYVEGSLQPNRNYEQTVTSAVSKTPLAPMAPATSNVYYAQPVANEQEPNTHPRQNFGRKIAENAWQPARQPSSAPTLPGQRPLNLDYQPDEDDEPSYPTYRQPQQPVHLSPRFQPPVPTVPANHRPTYQVEPDDSNLYGGLQPPRAPARFETTTIPPTRYTPDSPQSRPSTPRYTPDCPQSNPSTRYSPDCPQQQPSNRYSPDSAPLHPSTRYPSDPVSPQLHPPTRHIPDSPQLRPYASGQPGQRPLDLDYNPDADRQTFDQQDQLDGESQQQPSYRPPNPSVPANHWPTYRDQLHAQLHPQPQSHPVSNQSNLYGGLQPPTRPPAYQTTTNPTRTNLRTFPIYPPLANATPAQSPRPPHYSPPYAAVAHSNNNSGRKLPPRAPDPFNGQEDEIDYADYAETETTTQRAILRPTPIEHQFYKPTHTVDPQSKVALNEALRLMLRPYFNHSGNAQEAQAERAEYAIASVISKPPIATTPMPKTTTRRTRQESGKSPDDEVELIVAGEQESLDDDTDVDSVVSDVYETSRTEQTINPTTYASGHDTTDFQRGTRKVDVVDSSTVPNNWQDAINWQYRDHHRHHHHHHHPHHEHSRAYHSLHPNLPNPFPEPKLNEQTQQTGKDSQKQPQQMDQELDEQEAEFLPNPNAEATSPHTPIPAQNPNINLRSAFDEHCEFDCGGGKCVKRLELCDGINNCGNRQDEQQCDHLGYQVRLTGGESPHMGRIEVKVNGQWGYVCDDKFGLRDADVVCHELGFKLGAAEVRGNSYYEPPERNFNYAMDELECRGNETHLKDCDFKGWGVHNCGVDEVVGVVCKVPVLKCPNNLWLCHTSKECIPPAFVCDHTADCADKSDESDAVCKAPVEYRLEGGRSPIEGRLEVKYHGVWGSVCDDDFNLKSAQVACNALGYYGPAKIEKNIFGPGNGPIWLDQVMCFGNETSIDKCSHWNWGEHNCNHTEDVGLHCTAGPPPRQQRQKLKLQALNKDKSAAGTHSGNSVSLSDIGLWERSSKALRTPRRCGIFKDDLIDEFAHPEQRVVQGSVARRGRHPWQATIRTRGRGGISSHWCGAVVISKRHLLTAAHCLYGHPKGSYFVRVGDHYANIAEHSEVDTFIENWYTHEKFREPTHMNNDIAVVVLKTPLKFSDYVQPICLPERGAPLVENRTCTISGWGSIKSGVSTPSQELRAAQLPILPDATCKQMNVYGDAMTDGMFCAGSMDESVDACEGDSGGPLVCSDEDGETLYGIISWGQHCGYQNRPGVYVRVCHYIDWIYEKINQSLLRF